MANRKPSNKATQSSPHQMQELEKRIDALERRIAILEARLPQSTLAEKLKEPTAPARRIGLNQVQ